MMKRICMVVQNYYDIDPRVRREAESLVAEGYPVDVISLLTEGRSEKVYVLNGVHIYTVPLRKKRSGKVRYILEYVLFFVQAFFLVTRRMFAHRYRLVQIHTLPDFLVFTALVPKWMGAQAVLDMHEVMPEFYMSKFGVSRGSLLVRLLVLLEKWSVNFADRVIAANDPIAEQLVDRGLSPSKLTVVMNSADEKVFNADLYPASGAGDRDDAVVLMYHGTLTHIYGLDIALEALSIVQRLRPDLDLKFHILGVGPAQESLIQQSRQLRLDDHVRFLGRAPLDQVPEHLARCDVGLLPTRQDVFLDLSFSNKLVEYVVMCKPVIAARLKGYRRYFRETSFTFFAPGDPESLAQAIIRAATRRDEWPRLVNNALADYEAITWDVMAERYVGVIEGLLRE